MVHHSVQTLLVPPSTSMVEGRGRYPVRLVALDEPFPIHADLLVQNPLNFIPLTRLLHGNRLLKVLLCKQFLLLMVPQFSLGLGVIDLALVIGNVGFDPASFFL